MKEIRREIETLAIIINKANHEYYVDNNPILSDKEYDRNYKKLDELEKLYPQYNLVNSPIKKVGSDKTEGFEKYKHKKPMLSIQNALNEDEFKKWYGSFGCGESFTMEHKIDGLALSLHYSQGQLIRAITRGDGEEGDIVTANALVIEDIPSGISILEDLEVRGEVYLEKKQFDIINAKSKKKYKNPRNLASGTMKLHDPTEVLNRKLRFKAYEMIRPDVIYHKSYDSMYDCDKLGFNIILPVVMDTWKEIIDYYEFCEKEKDHNAYEMDGVVIKINDNILRNHLGATSKYHKWQIAYKFPQPKITAKLLSVVHQVGRTGILTPVANLSPTEILGTTVRRATLHNYNQIKELGLMIGDTIFLEKGGEIIPKVVGVDFSKRDNLETSIIKTPFYCPECDSILKKDGALLKCDSLTCPAQKQGRFEHFVSKKGMNIDGFGIKTIEQFLNEGIIEDIEDIYKLDIDDIYQLEGWALGSATKLLEAIENSMKPTLVKFIYALGIPGVGAGTAKDLAIHFETYSDMMCYFDSMSERNDRELVVEIDGIGDKIEQELHDWFDDSDNGYLLKQLFNLGIRPQDYVNNVYADLRFQNKTVVLTGALSIERSKMKEKLENIGIKVTGSVSKNTNYIMVGSNPGSKYSKAQKLGIEIVNEHYFFGE